MTNRFPIFEVPIIPPGLKQEETLFQIADCLDYLAKVTDTVFDCINVRIDENKKKINELDLRVSVAKVKVEKLKGVKKATQIFSTSKYPASDIYKDYLSIFHKTSKLDFLSSQFRLTEKRDSSKIEPSLEEKLQFFHVKSGKTYKEKNLDKGLGKLPFGVESVSSLLLFNTCENPYEKCVSLDPMGVVSKIRKNLNEDAPSQMEAAPISISKQEQLEEQMKENYFYSPSLGDVPNIDAPLDLPDLPGIADDLKYNLDLGPGFAPSVTTTPAVPDLPTIPEDSFQNLISIDNLDTEHNSHVSFVQVPPPPPPPPPSPPPIRSSPALTETIPPPPPPLPAENEREKLSTLQPSPAVIHATTDNARANLMAAIRNAGGMAKLKPIKSGRDESKRIKEEKNLATGDLMADLHNKLLMRRKGISGKVKKDGGPTGSVMDKVSAMIPPPVQQEMSSATEDEDWED